MCFRGENQLILVDPPRFFRITLKIETFLGLDKTLPPQPTKPDDDVMRGKNRRNQGSIQDSAYSVLSKKNVLGVKSVLTDRYSIIGIEYTPVIKKQRNYMRVATFRKATKKERS